MSGGVQTEVNERPKRSVRETRVQKVRPEFNVRDTQWFKGRDHILTRDQGSISATLDERERPEFNVRDHSLMRATRV